MRVRRFWNQMEKRERTLHKIEGEGEREREREKGGWENLVMI